jgi:hypothetical protein
VGSFYQRKLIDIIKKDAAFFGDNGIIDYSLLVGIHNKSEHPTELLQSQQNVVLEQELLSQSETGQKYDNWNESLSHTLPNAH